MYLIDISEHPTNKNVNIIKGFRHGATFDLKMDKWVFVK